MALRVVDTWGVSRHCGPKNHTRKIIKIYKDFLNYTNFSYNIFCPKMS